MIFYDDLKADTAGVYRDVLRFLEIDDTLRPEFPVKNPNSVVRSGALRQFLRHPPQPLRTVSRLAVRNQTTRLALGRRLVEMNTVYVSRPPLDRAIRRQLTAELAPDIAELEKQVGRDLSTWSVP